MPQHSPDFPFRPPLSPFLQVLGITVSSAKHLPRRLVAALVARLHQARKACLRRARAQWATAAKTSNEAPFEASLPQPPGPSAHPSRRSGEKDKQLQRDSDLWEDHQPSSHATWCRNQIRRP